MTTVRMSSVYLSNSQPSGSQPSSSQPSSTSGPFPVFPNGPYVSKFFVSSQNSGLDHLDIDLYNQCYLPYNPLSYNNKKAKRSGVSKPDYDSDLPPCKRQAAINSNCYFTWNGTLASIDVSQDAAQQQECFCGTYPFFEAVGGCQACFEEHGGVEGMSTCLVYMNLLLTLSLHRLPLVSSQLHQRCLCDLLQCDFSFHRVLPFRQSMGCDSRGSSGS